MPLVFPSPLNKKNKQLPWVAYYQSMQFVDPIVWTKPVLRAVGAKQNIHKNTEGKTHTDMESSETACGLV